MRKALANCLIDYAEADERVFFITADLGFGVFDEFKSRFPKRYKNVGIAEAGMVSVAAGLASEGWKPYVYSIASFLLPKTYEQLRLLLAYNENKIVLIGAGGGFAYSMSGPSHHSLDDISLALLIPDLNVFAPSGPSHLLDAMELAKVSDKSSYIQIGKFGEPDIPRIVSLQNSNLALISTGVIANEAYSLYEELAKNNNQISFLNVNRLNPFDDKEILQFLEGKHKIIVIEENYGRLSLFSLLQSLVIDEAIKVELIRIGPDHRIFAENFERINRLTNFGLSLKSLEDKFFSPL